MKCSLREATGAVGREATFQALQWLSSCLTSTCRCQVVWVCIIMLIFIHNLSSGLYLFYLTGIAPGEMRSHADYSATNPMVADYIVLVSMGKKEGLVLREWVSHHKSIGVDHIVFYDDTPKGEDGGALPLLQDYVNSGFLEVHDATHWDNRSFIFSSDITFPQREYHEFEQQFFYDKQQKMQIDTWRRYQKELNPKRHIWLAQVDVDEMYNPPRNESLKDLLQRVRVQGARSVRAVKLEFGPNGHTDPPYGDLRLNYILREDVGSKHTGLALVSAITGMASGCPHVYVTNSFIADLFRGSHECNDWHGEKYPGKIRYGVYYARKEELTMNHYQTKSYKECYHRSSIPHPDGRQISRHCTDPKYNVCDDTIQRYVHPGDSIFLGNQHFLSRCANSAYRETVLAKAEAVRQLMIDRHAKHTQSESI